MQPIAIVTGNHTKFEAMRSLLEAASIPANQLDLSIDEIQDLDGRRVVTDKACKAFAAAGRPVLVDDSGIYFERYNNFPGIFSKLLYQAVNFDGIFKLVQPGDKAYFQCFVAYMDETLAEPMIFEGVTHGTIAAGKVDSNKVYEMPYAPIFKPDGETKVMSDMSSLERAYDHRSQAVNQFIQFYKQHHL